MPVFFILQTLSSAALANNCISPKLSKPESATVKYVIDGDTISLTTHQRIRIIGIDTPEVKHHKQLEQPYAEEAKQALVELLRPYNNHIFLRYEKEPFDRYGRKLAHIYLPSGTNVSTWLLERGYAKTLAFPPNTLLADCYRNSQRYAQSLSLKIWREPSNQLKDASTLPLEIKGYVQLRGKVKAILNHRKSTIIELDSAFNRHIELKVTKKFLAFFKKTDINDLRNKTIHVSGILRNRNNKRTLYLKHPSQIEVIQGKRAPKKKPVAPMIKWSSNE